MVGRSISGVSKLHYSAKLRNAEVDLPLRSDIEAMDLLPYYMLYCMVSAQQTNPFAWDSRIFSKRLSHGLHVTRDDPTARDMHVYTHIPGLHMYVHIYHSVWHNVWLSCMQTTPNPHWLYKEHTHVPSQSRKTLCRLHAYKILYIIQLPRSTSIVRCMCTYNYIIFCVAWQLQCMWCEYHTKSYARSLQRVFLP